MSRISPPIPRSHRREQPRARGATRGGRPTRARRGATNARLAAISVLLGLTVLSGCGSSNKTPATAQNSTATHAATQTTTPATTGPPATTTTPAAKPKKEHLPRVEKVGVASPAISAQGKLDARYTCDGTDTPLPITWTGIPPGTKELMLDIINQVPVNGQLYIDWSVAHINPHLHQLGAGQPPAGATTGTNSTGTTKYTICPAHHATSQYVIVLFALPHALPIPKGYNAAELRTQALHTANYENFQIFTYTRH